MQAHFEVFLPGKLNFFLVTVVFLLSVSALVAEDAR